MLALDSTNEIAREYSMLSQQWLELSAQQAFSDWRANFDNRHFDKAASAYERIRSSMPRPLATQLASQAESEYGKVLSGLVTSWKAACASGDPTKMDAIRKEAVTVSSGLQLGSSAFAEMEQCISKSCMHGDPVLALKRLKKRINPQIEPSLQRYLSRVRVSIEIDQHGNVNVKQITNANNRLAEALKGAIEQWEFYPTVIDDQPRCVETELPIILIQP